jgi:hypothetical protein
VSWKLVNSNQWGQHTAGTGGEELSSARRSHRDRVPE